MPEQNSKEAMQRLLSQLEQAKSGAVEFDEFIELWSRFLRGGALDDLTKTRAIDRGRCRRSRG